MTMSDALPAEITVTELSDGVRYRLPIRPASRYKLPAPFAMLGGVVGAAFLSFWVWAVGSGIDLNDPLELPNFAQLLFVLIGVAMWLGTVAMFVFGLYRLVGHSEIEVRSQTISGFACLGWLRLRWDWPLVGLCRFDVRTAYERDHAVQVYASAEGALQSNAIFPIWDVDTRPPDEKPSQLAPGYPRAWLLPLAKELARRCQLAAVERQLGVVRMDPPQIDVTEAPPPNASGFIDELEQPPTSRLLMEPSETGVKWTVPANAVGLGRVVLEVSGDELTVQCDRLFGGKRHRWQRRQLADICVARIIDSEGPDSTELHIQPHPGEGKRLRLDFKDEAEARWLATSLRRALALPEDAASTFLERETPPAGCLILQQTSPDGVSLTVPPLGLAKPSIQFTIILCLILLGVAVGFGCLLYLTPVDPEDAGVPRSMLLFAIIGPGLIVLTFLLDALNRAIRRAVLRVVADTLIVQETTLTGTSERNWSRPRVLDIRVGSAAERNLSSPYLLRRALDQHDPTWELQIRLKDASIVGLLDNYGDAELQWVATVLRRALRVPRNSLGE
jgi:hypothetical protein